MLRRRFGSLETYPRSRQGRVTRAALIKLQARRYDGDKAHYSSLEIKQVTAGAVQHTLAILQDHGR